MNSLSTFSFRSLFATLVLSLTLLASHAGIVATAHAQEAAQEAAPADSAEEDDPAEGRSTAFRAVSGAETESVPGGTLLIAAYGIAWAFVLMFIVRIGRLANQNAGALAELSRRVTAGDE